jgi:hypothetical protein
MEERSDRRVELYESFWNGSPVNSRFISLVKGKGHLITGHQELRRGSRDIALLIPNTGARGMGVQHHVPPALTPWTTRYPLYRRLGGPQGRFGRVRDISPSQDFDPRTVQTVVSHYTDWATRPYFIGTYIK